MADITTKMSVTGLSQYKKAMGDAAASVKTLDEELKLNEEQLKANGNQELYMANKVAILKDRIEAQKKVVSNAESALKAMRENGVEPSSKSFQTMQQKVYSAATKLTAMKTELRNVESGADGAKKETSGMNEELQKVGKGIAWQNVTSGLKEITRQLQSGARAAVQFGRKVAKSAMDSTEWADDVMTRATKYGVDAETVQRMDKVAEYIDTDVDTIIAAQKRLAKNKDSLGDLLGLDVNGMSIDDAFWKAGEAISNMTDEWEQQEAAQKVFGRNWDELLPLFKAGQEEYTRLMEEQSVLSNENVEKLQQADDAIKSVKQQIELMKNQFWADNADKITELLQWVMDNKDGIVAALGAIGVAFAGLKIAEFSASMMQAVNGMKELLGLGGSKQAQSLGIGNGNSGGNGGTNSSNTSTSSSGFSWAGVVNKIAISTLVYPTMKKLVEEGITNISFKDVGKTGLDIIGGEGTGALLDKVKPVGKISVQDAVYKELGIGGGGSSGGHGIAVPVEPVAPDNSAEIIKEDIGTVQVPVQLVVKNRRDSFGLSDSFLGGSHANGLPYVPFDGYLGILHRGERILPASQNKSYTYNNNTYFGSVNLHNGLEVDALTDSIARNNKRKSRGYGS